MSMNEGEPPDAFPRGCCLAMLASIMFEVLLVAGITWLIIR